MKNSQKGFTLIELLLVIGLIGLTVGVTGDIILSLIRSYSKTQSTTDVERAANFAAGKLEKEFKNAVSVTSIGTLSLAFDTKNSDGVTTSVVYTIDQGNSCRFSTSDPALPSSHKCLRRSAGAGSPVLLTDSFETKLSASSNFSEVISNPSTLKMELTFTKANNSTGVFSGSVDINTTVIAKGTYK